MSVVSNTVHNAIQNSSRSKIASSAPTCMLEQCSLLPADHRTWRFASFCVHLLGILMHWERPFSPRAVKVIVDGVVHENLTIRKVRPHVCLLMCHLGLLL